MGEGDWICIGRLDQLADQTAAHLDLAGHSICLARSGAGVYALKDECSHGQVRLSEGEVENGFIECWRHGSRFDLTTGAPTGPPAVTLVPVYPVRMDGGVVEVQVPSRGEGVAYA